VTRVPLQQSELKLPFNWRYGPGNRDIGDASYVTTQFTYQGLGLRPLSPVHVKGVRASGDLSISWIRRTRSGGDNWELPEVPLGEDAETYEVDVLDGTNVTRTLSVSSPVALYSSADQIADFGSVQSAVSIKVYQINTLFGRGAPRAAHVCCSFILFHVMAAHACGACLPHDGGHPGLHDGRSWMAGSSPAME
jgi:hypothetical protein